MVAPAARWPAGVLPARSPRRAPTAGAARPARSTGPSLADVRVSELVGSMAVQTVQAPAGGGVSLEAPKAEMVPGVVNFYAGVLDLGQLTCRLLLKEYPTTTRSLGVNEIRAYGELLGPQEGFFTELLRQAAQEMEAGAEQGWEQPVPPLYAAFEAYLAEAGEPGGGRQLQATVDDSGEGGASPSVWLAFRYGEHGTTTLLDFQAAHLSARKAAAKEAWLRRTGSTTDDYGKNLRSVLSILMPFERVPEDPSARWAAYVRAAMRGSLRALARAHGEGVAHGSLSGACLLVNTVAPEEAAALRVRLYNFGYASLPLLDQEGPQAAAQAFREDIFNLGLAFADLLFPSMAAAGTDFRRVAVDVYDCDMQAVAEFVAEEEPWGAALLSERQGAGWELLRAMLLRGGSGSGGGLDTLVIPDAAQRLLRSRFFDDSG
eukprot:jgi/Tetstr1/427403/TSEL_017567.t1